MHEAIVSKSIGDSTESPEQLTGFSINGGQWMSYCMAVLLYNLFRSIGIAVNGREIGESGCKESVYD